MTLTNKRLSLTEKLKSLQCYIQPVLLIACETWTRHKTEKEETDFGFRECG